MACSATAGVCAPRAEVSTTPAEESASTLALFPGPLLALNGRFVEPRYRRLAAWIVSHTRLVMLGFGGWLLARIGNSRFAPLMLGGVGILCGTSFSLRCPVLL